VAGVTAWEPVAASLPLQAPLAAQETAWVLDHISVADWPAVIEVGLTDRVTVGIGAGGAVDLLPPQACSARAMRAAAAAGQGSRIRKLVRIGDMLPRPSGVLRRRRPNTIQRGGGPTSMESCGGTLVPRVNSHTARLAPPEFYSVTRTNKQFSQAFQPFPGLTHIRTVAAGTAQIASPRPLILIYFFRLIPLLGVSFNCRWVRVGCEFQLPFFAKLSDATQARAGRKRTRSAPLA
jgi:hypothetical protein